MEKLQCKRIFSVLLAMLVAITLKAQSKDAAVNQRIIETKNYVFVAQTASPQRGRDVHLTSRYDLVVAGDSIVCDLPYYGRAYSAPINPSEGGIHFASAKSDYSVSANTKKKKWTITIKPKDVSGVDELTLEIFDNGSASLHATLRDRQSISFNGYIEEGKGVTKKGF
jgi:hypothetical protein